MAILTQNNTPLYEGRHVTREEYLDLPDDGFRYEMIEGVLHMSPSAFYEHNRVLTRILTKIENYVEKTNIARPTPETDIFLPDGGDILRPDISVILEKNYNIIMGHIHGVPDIVVEVLSDSTRERDLGAKADRYLSNGVKEYWIADPSKKTLDLWINELTDSPKRSWRKINADEIQSKVLPELVIKPGEVFTEACF